MKTLLKKSAANGVITLYMLFVVLFILAPIIIVVAISFNPVSYAIFPPIGFSFRWYIDVLLDNEWRSSFGNSIKIATFTALGATIIGTFAANGLHRGSFRGRTLLINIFMSPLVLPGLIIGLAILFLFSFMNWISTSWALILGHMVITYPYVLRLVLVSLSQDITSYEEAAMSLGADEMTTFRLVTLPIIKKGIVGGAIFAFIISFDNITISLFLADSRVNTLPIRIMEHIRWSGSPSVAAISSLLIALTLGLALIIEKTIGLHKVFAEGSDEVR